MFDANFTITTEADETDAQIMSVVIGRAIRRLEYLDLLDALDSDDRKLMFNLKCSEKLIEDACCLNCFIGRIGEDQFESMVTAMWLMRWGDEDAFLTAYLDSWVDRFETADEENDADDETPISSVILAELEAQTVSRYGSSC